MLVFPITFNQTVSGGSQPNYYAWEFDSDLTELNNSGKDWTVLDPTKVTTQTYTTAKVNNGLNWQHTNTYFTSFTGGINLINNNPGEKFYIRQGEPFAISFWLKVANHSCGLVFQDENENVIWQFCYQGSYNNLFYGFPNSSNSSTNLSPSLGLTTGQWYFFWLVYDGTVGGNHAPDFGYNDVHLYNSTASDPLTTTNNYNSNYRLCLRGGYGAEMGIDQLVIWHTEVKTVQDMINLYNGGVGISIPNYLSPPVSTANYYAWEFEDDYSEYNSTFGLAWVEDIEVTESYATAKVNKGIEFTVPSSDRVLYRINDPGEDFNIDWSKPWAFSVWFKIDTNNRGGHVLTLRDTSNTTGKTTDRIWVWNLYRESNSTINNAFQFAINGSNSIVEIQQNMGSVDNEWHFYYLRYDPSEPKKIYAGYDNNAESSATALEDWYFTTYNSSYSLAITSSGSSFAVGIDQLTFWHTEVKTRQDMLDLYNEGSGLSIEKHLSSAPRYVAWEFEDNMIDQTSSLTWNNLLSYPLTYPNLKIDKGVQFTAGTGDIDIFHIVDPGEEFLISWDIPWAISVWLNRPYNNDIFSVNLKDTNSGARMDNTIWSLGFWQQGVYVDLATDLNHTLTAQNCQFTSVSGALNFFYIRYSPVEQKKIYYGANNQAEQSKTFTNSLPFTTYNSSWTLAFGVNNIGSRTFQLDQLAFWHTQVKTRQDMLDLYNEGSGLSIETYLSSEPRYYAWEFEDNLTDVGGNAYTWTELDNTKTTTLNYVTGKVNKALNLQHSNSTLLTPGGTNLNFITNDQKFAVVKSSVFAFSMWIKHPSTSSGSLGFIVRDTSGNFLWGFSYQPSFNNMYIDYRDSSDTYRQPVRSITDTPGTWTFLWAIYNPLATGFEVRLGQNATSSVVTNSNNLPASRTPVDLQIYLRGGLNELVQYDQIVFWHTEQKTEQDMLDLYNSGIGREDLTLTTPTFRDEVLSDNPLAYYRFNETSGTTVADLGSLGFDLTLSSDMASASSLSTGTTGARVLYDPPVYAYTSPTTSIGTDAPMSIEIVFATEETDIDLFGISNSNIPNNASASERALYIDSNGYIAFYSFDTSGWTMTTTTTVNDGQPHHVVVVTESGNALTRLYVDGVQVATTARGNYGSYGANARINLGAKNGASSYPFNTFFDELAYYNTALTAQQVSDHYNALGTLVTPTFPTGDLTTTNTNWVFNNSLVDSDGLLTWTDNYSKATYVTGKVTNGLEFNGSTNLNTRQFEILDPGSEFMFDWDIPWCISLWYKQSTGGTNSCVIQLRTDATDTWDTPFVWTYYPFYNNNSYFFVGQSSGTNFQYRTSGAMTAWSFCYARYNPSEQKKVYLGFNDTAEVAVTFTSNFFYQTYSSAYRLSITTRDNPGTIGINQLALWTGTAKSQLDMKTLYNYGNGAPIP